MMPGNSCVQPEKLAEASQLLVTMQKLNKLKSLLHINMQLYTC